MHRTLLLATSGVDKVASYSRRIIDFVSLALRLKFWDEASQRTRLKFKVANRNQTSSTIWTHLRFGPKL
jgi:hypothetical protein